MSIKGMPFVTVEQVNALRAEALRIESLNAELLAALQGVVTWYGKREALNGDSLLPAHHQQAEIRVAMSAIAKAANGNDGVCALNGEVRLWDSQWVSIVNNPEVLAASDAEEAVAIAVRMTEAAIARNFATSSFPLPRSAGAPSKESTR